MAGRMRGFVANQWPSHRCTVHAAPAASVCARPTTSSRAASAACRVRESLAGPQPDGLLGMFAALEEAGKAGGIVGLQDQVMLLTFLLSVAIIGAIYLFFRRRGYVADV